jgi:Stress responsive A/B Barrel Domain
MSVNKRRNFIKQSALALTAGTLSPSFSVQGNDSKLKTMFIHQVYFWLKNPQSSQDRDKLLEGLIKLKKVKSIKMVQIGVPAATSRDVIDGTYTFSWLTIFASPQDQDAYQVDPIHKKFVDDYAHLWSKVIVYDSVSI